MTACDSPPITTTSTPPRNNSRRRIPPGLLRRPAAAAHCGIGGSTLDRLNAAGLTPQPVRLGGSLAFSRAELAAWCARGCPPRDQWSAMWKAILATRTGVRK